MKRFLNGALVIAGLVSSQVYGAVIDKFDCQFGIRDLLTEVASSTNSSLESLRNEIQKPENWSERVRLFSGDTFTIGSLKNPSGTIHGTYSMHYFVAQQYSEAGQLIAAKVLPGNLLSGNFCEPNKPCLLPGQSLTLPVNDPFLHPTPNWKDMGIFNGLAVLNAEDFRIDFSPFRDPNGRFLFVLNGGCSFKASIKPAPGE